MHHVDRPNYVFIVQSAIPQTGKVYETFAIEQYVTNPRDKHDRDRVYNQIQRHLSDLSTQTGLMYDLVYWASPERAYGLYPDTEIKVG